MAIVTKIRVLYCRHELPHRERTPSHSRSISTDFHAVGSDRPASSVPPRRVRTSPAAGTTILSHTPAGSAHAPLPIGSGRHSSMRSASSSSGPGVAHLSRSSSGASTDIGAAAAAAAAALHGSRGSGPSTPSSARDRYLSARRSGSLRPPSTSGGPDALLPLVGSPVGAMPNGTGQSSLRGVPRMLNLYADESNKLHTQLSFIHEHSLQERSQDLLKMKSTVLNLQTKINSIVENIVGVLFSVSTAESFLVSHHCFVRSVYVSRLIEADFVNKMCTPISLYYAFGLPLGR